MMTVIRALISLACEEHVGQSVSHVGDSTENCRYGRDPRSKMQEQNETCSLQRRELAVATDELGEGVLSFQHVTYCSKGLRLE